MNSDNERKTGCYNCHGTVVAIDENGKKAYIYPDYPNATGDTTRPPKIFGE